MLSTAVTRAKSKKKINHYYILNQIGKGSFSEVFLGYDEQSQKSVAIKCISSSELSTVKLINSFNMSIENLKHLDHPNIIKFIDHVKTKNNHYIVLEYANGGDLHTLLNLHYQKTKNPFPEKIVQKIVRQVAKGLKYLHNKSIIHRDIKLDNLLVQFNGRENEFENFVVKIADFNLSKDISFSPAKSICGNPLTMAPDVMTKNYNTSADLWSLGAVTFELIIGQPPFNAGDAKEIYKDILRGKYCYPNDINISVECISFINGLLRVDPSKRMTWKEIENHPFIKNNYEDFKRIDLTLCCDNDKLMELEMNAKGENDFIWKIYEGGNKIGVNLDNINSDWIGKINKDYYGCKCANEIKKDNHLDFEELSKEATNYNGWEVI